MALAADGFNAAIASGRSQRRQDVWGTYFIYQNLCWFIVAVVINKIDWETHLRKTLNEMRPYIQSHGGNVELVSPEGDGAILRLQGACKTRHSSVVALVLAVRRAVEEPCPDLMGLEAEGVTGGCS